MKMFLGDFGRLIKNPGKQLKDWAGEIFDPKSWANFIGDIADDIGQGLEIAGTLTGQPEFIAIGQTLNQVSNVAEKLAHEKKQKVIISEDTYNRMAKQLYDALPEACKRSLTVEDVKNVIKMCQSKECIMRNINAVCKPILEKKEEEHKIEKPEEEKIHNDLIKPLGIAFLGYLLFKGK